jgi:hypothetical protein
MNMAKDVVTVVSTATSASITNINKKLKQVRATDNTKNSSRFYQNQICEMIIVLLYQYCIDFSPNNDNEFLYSSQIALWACRAISNLSKNTQIKMKFTEIGAKETVFTLGDKYGNLKNVVEWINLAKESLN